MARRLPTRITLVAILLVAAFLRLHNINWDDGIRAHPDERYVIGVVENLLWTGDLNPFVSDPDYAYGHLPLYLLAITSHLAPTADVLVLGRVLAALFDVGTVAVTFALGRRVHDEQVGLLAAGFLALTVLHVQQAHFYTADALLAFFTLGMLWFAVRFAQGGEAVDAWLAGAWAGLALGTKASAGLQVVPLSAACMLVSKKRQPCLWRCGVTAIVVFALTNPFALVQLPTFRRNVGQQAAILRGAVDVPYTRQYCATFPYIYPIVQQWRWGMGWLSSLAAFGGLSRAVFRAVRTPPRPAEWVMLAWVLPYFAFVGALHVTFPRYLLPLTPILAIYAALLVADVARLHSGVSDASCLVLLGSMLLRCVLLVNMYCAPHPWVSASDWFYENAQPGAIIATEEWDHALPLETTGYDVRVLPVFDEETREKWVTIEGVLAEADYVVIASRRAYATLAGMPERYPRTARYYKHLFEGKLGLEVVACFRRFPSLGLLAVVDDPTIALDFALPEPCRMEGFRVLRWGQLDESFVVYDHPQVLVFEASG
jgi:4-amino-4-deoxy-L-arabinose transferase-like glycosyltransferase